MQFIIVMVGFGLATATGVMLIQTDYHSWTKGIYNGTYIQDNYIECNGHNILSIKPISKSVYVGTDWVDLRPEELKDLWC